MKYFWWFFIIFLWIQLPQANANSKQETLHKIKMIERATGCTLGVSAMHIESHKGVNYHGQMLFFMASTVKIPIAITLLLKVDHNKERLNRLISFNQNDSVPGSGSLYDDLSQHPRAKIMPLRKLLELMLVTSDNTASDLVLKEINGPKSVSSCLKKLGFNHIHVNRSIMDLYLSSSGLNIEHAKKIHQIQKLNFMLEHVNLEKKVQAWKRFEIDPRDNTTAKDMMLLLARLYEGKIISPSNTKLLLTTMAHCQTGQNRIKGLLPDCVKVAHKTGTWAIDKNNFIHYPGSRNLYRFANDVGIIALPKNKGHVAIAIYVKSKGVNNLSRERAIAMVSKEIYQYFLQ